MCVGRKRGGGEGRAGCGGGGGCGSKKAKKGSERLGRASRTRKEIIKLREGIGMQD